MFRRLPSDSGIKITSRNGWFYFGWNTSIYRFHVEFGRVSFGIEQKYSRG